MVIRVLAYLVSWLSAYPNPRLVTESPAFAGFGGGEYSSDDTIVTRISSYADTRLVTSLRLGAERVEHYPPRRPHRSGGIDGDISDEASDIAFRTGPNFELDGPGKRRTLLEPPGGAGCRPTRSKKAVCGAAMAYGLKGAIFSALNFGPRYSRRAASISVSRCRAKAGLS